MTRDFATTLAQLAPSLAGDIDAAKSAQLHLARMVIEAKKVPRAARLICVLAAGDIGDLLDDVERGAGRSAIRATRSLIEHQVNMHTVLSSDVSADRYMAHLELGPLLLRDSYEAYYLDRNLARSVKHVAK